MNQLDLLQPKTASAISNPKQWSVPSAKHRSSVQILPIECTHPRIFPGLDALFCPDCEKSITSGTTGYNEIRRKQS